MTLKFFFVNGSVWHLPRQTQLHRICGQIFHSQLSVQLYLVASGRMERLWATVENCKQEWIAHYQEGASARFIPDWGLSALRMNLRQNSALLLLLSVFPHKISLLLHPAKLTSWILSLSALSGNPNGEALKCYYVLDVLANCRKFGEWQLILAMDAGTQAWLSFWHHSQLAAS